MARKRENFEPDADLNLAPMMNLVIILIPMLLLSVVFLEVGVINITAPQLSVGGQPSEPKEDDKEPLNLTVAISAKGFQIAASGYAGNAQAGCPPQGPTICLEDQSVDVAGKFEQARRVMEQGQGPAGEIALNEGILAYNFRELYNSLMKIKENYPEETVITLTADHDVPYAVLVRVMDVARFKLTDKSYDSTPDFWNAEYETAGTAYAELFSDPVLSILQ